MVEAAFPSGRILAPSWDLGSRVTFPGTGIKLDMGGLRLLATALGLASLLGLPSRGLSGSAELNSSQPDTTTASDSVVTFNEIMYHPGGSVPDIEWVELFNAMSIDIDLSNWRIEGGITYSFPTNTVLSSRGYVLVASDPIALQTTVDATNVLGPFAGKLGNNGQNLRLRNNSGRIMDELSFGDEAPWPVAADGSGASLAKRNRYNASSPAANWQASPQPGGTPGRLNFPEYDPDGSQEITFIGSASTGRWSVTAFDLNGLTWMLPVFDDSTWAPGTASLGFDVGNSSSNALSVARAYSFDGNARDISGNGYDGQNLGAQFSTNVSQVSGSTWSAQFDGSLSQVKVADPVNPKAYTLSLWVSVDTVQSCSLLVRTDASGPRSSWSHQLRINSAGQFEHYLYDGNLRSVAATNIIRPGVWYHVAATASNNGLMQIYVNGISSGGSITIGSLWAGGDQWQFGTDSGQTPNYFRGRLDEAGIWEEVLGEEDIARLAAGTPPVLLGGYHDLITTDLESALFRVNSSLLVRLPFNVSAGMGFEKLTLNVRYDDGFVVYLNGTEVARRNAPETLNWNSTSTIKRPAGAVFSAETIDLSSRASSLTPGRNVLAFQALNASASDTNFLIMANLTAVEAPIAAGQANLAFNEIDAAESPAFFLELINYGTSELPLAGFSINSSAGPRIAFTSGSVGPGGFLTVRTNELGFSVQAGDKLFLAGPNLNILDAVKVSSRLQGRLSARPSDSWLYPSAPTPGAPNLFSFHNEIVINEILYHHSPSYSTNANSPAMVTSDEQWIELYNRSQTAVDLGGWQLADAVKFIFPSNSILAPDGYLVVANHSAILRTQNPDITVLGDFEGKLSHRGDRVRLLDAQGNPVNEVSYFPEFPWPAYADGGGSSLELRDPRADNSVAESWASSLEASEVGWRRYTYRARAINPVYSPNLYSFNEFRLGLLDSGEALLDNITVVELATNAAPRQLIQNTTFSNGTASWRLVGNHVHSRVEPSPDAPTNYVLHLVATGPMTYLENQLETTLKANNVSVPVVAGRDYEISFDAKWLAGSPQLHTELYYNRVVAKTLLEVSIQPGTPGRRNSTYRTNTGPTYLHLQHSPVLPASTDNIAISVAMTDPDGLSAAKLYYSINNLAWKSIAMTVTGSESTPYITYTATIPAQPAGAVIQFYVQGTDSAGVTSTFPAAGPYSRALIKVDAPQLRADKQTLRTILTPSDSTLLHSFVNLMSDDMLGCTVIHNESEVFYDARIRLHGSMFSRPDASQTGLKIDFPSDHLFRGSRPSVTVRRGNIVETIGHHILNQAGGLPGSYGDVIHLVSHRSDNLGTATLQLAELDRTYIDSQYENNNDGTLFKLEGIRVYQSTDDGTPEGYKLPQPVDFVWNYDITNLGDDPEQYRWSQLILNQRARDDYSRIVALGKAFSLTGTALQKAVADVIDIDEWARYFALQNLLGIGDIYGVDNPHNVAFYARPDDGRLEVLQNDWGFAYNLASNASIYGTQKIYQILRLPIYRRIYQGHLLDLINTIYNSAYLTRWAQHFSGVTGADFSAAPGYADARGAAVRSQLAPKVVFAITSNGGQDFTVSTPTVTLAGVGWIDIHDIGLGGRSNLLSVTWIDDQRWQATVPLQPGTNRVQLVAYDYRGNTVGQAAIQVVSTSTGMLQRDYLRITELMYHPPPPTAQEIAAGFTSAEDFEFIELVNTGPSDLSLLGVRFTDGVLFDFTASAITNLTSSQRVLVVANKSAFAFRYGTNLPVSGAFTGHLNNAGELLRLVDAWGNIIQEVAYQPDTGWPLAADGQGSSLEVIDLNAYVGNPLNWQASFVAGGTPGKPAVFRPAFTQILLDAAQVHLWFNAAPEQTYTVEWRASLTSGDWQTLATIPAQQSARVEVVTDALQPGISQRNYRLRTP